MLSGSLLSAVGSSQNLEKSGGFWGTLTEMSFIVRCCSFSPEEEIKVHESPRPGKEP